MMEAKKEKEMMLDSYIEERATKLGESFEVASNWFTARIGLGAINRAMNDYRL